MEHIGPHTYLLGQPMIKTPTTEEANILNWSSTEKIVHTQSYSRTESFIAIPQSWIAKEIAVFALSAVLIMIKYNLDEFYHL